LGRETKGRKYDHALGKGRQAGNRAFVFGQRNTGRNIPWRRIEPFIVQGDTGRKQVQTLDTVQEHRQKTRPFLGQRNTCSKRTNHSLGKGTKACGEQDQSSEREHGKEREVQVGHWTISRTQRHVSWTFWHVPNIKQTASSERWSTQCTEQEAGTLARV
jgi:hypothetical protein